ncbi:MAG: C39 family peptidase [Hespellia sp.]|nr:C39 family peptidase [Hespellia sp.]
MKNSKRKLNGLYLGFFLILLLFEAVVVGRTMTMATVQPVMSVVNLTQMDLNSEIIVEAPISYDLEGAVKQLTIMQAKDHRYARIVNHRSDYPERLLINLANNPELLSFVLEYPQDTGYQDDISLSTQELTDSCPLFLQWDIRWGYQAYGDNNIACSGCGPTALSMVIVGLTHNAKATPAQVAQFAAGKDYYEKGIGTKWELMDAGPAAYGLTSETIAADEAGMKQQLDAGKFLIASMKAGDFTTGGHFIVICGYNDRGFKIRDPFCIYRTGQTWDFATLNGQLEGLWAIGKS